MADLPPYHPPSWLFGQIGCNLIIEMAPHRCAISIIRLLLIYRLAHRVGGLPRPPCPPALRGSLAVSAADARIYMFVGGGGRAVVARLFIGVYLAVRAVRVRPFHPRL